MHWADLEDYSTDSILISDVGWWPDGTAVTPTSRTGPRPGSTRPVRGGRRAGSPKRLFRETTRAWIDCTSDGASHRPDFLDDGTFLWPSERDGWKHLYHYAADGRSDGPVTTGEWEVRRGSRRPGDGPDLLHRHPRRSARHEPLPGQVRRSGIERLTPSDGKHASTSAPTASSSSRLAPTPKRRRRSASTRLTVAGPHGRHEPRPRAQGVSVRPARADPDRSRDGFPLEAELIFPPDLDPTRNIPSGSRPTAARTARRCRDAWAGGRLWDQALAHEGFIVFRIDPRSASGKGAISAWRPTSTSASRNSRTSRTPSPG